VQQGEFFGVKSAMGRFPREENAVSLSDSSLMAFTVPEFEALASTNTRIILKMLKVFSNQMRRIHRQVSNLMEKEEMNPDVGLFNTGEYYLKNKRFSHAKYTLSRYLTYYPSGKNAAQAAKNLEVAETALSRYGDGKGPGVSAVSPAAANTQSNSTPSGNAGLDSGGGPPEATTKAYYDALSLVSQEKYQQAYMAFKKIEEQGGDPEWMARCSYEIGRCLYLLGKYDDCIKYYTSMLTKYPKYPDIRDVMFFMGQSHEKGNRRDQAIAFYKKLLSMSADEDNGTTIKTKRALKALGV
jgi:TolA-binding protein